MYSLASEVEQVKRDKQATDDLANATLAREVQKDVTIKKLTCGKKTMADKFAETEECDLTAD